MKQKAGLKYTLYFHPSLTKEDFVRLNDAHQVVQKKMIYFGTFLCALLYAGFRKKLVTPQFFGVASFGYVALNYLQYNDFWEQ